jgi:TonB family protein
MWKVTSDRLLTIMLINLVVCLGLFIPERVSGQSFNDVPTDYWAYSVIENFAAIGITAGCGNDNYCPEDPVTRAQMAVFLERAIHGSGYQPPPASGNLFLDVGANDFAAAYIEQLFNDGITGGCGGNNYCPTQEINRAQMAVFLLKAKYGSGYSPSAATGIFNDVDLSYWAVHWIEALAAEGITAGCGNGNYCPEDAVTRAQMAVFLVRSFGLTSFSEYELIVRVAPVYPARALSRGLEGYVDLSFTVTATGAVADPIVVFSTSSLFERAAIRAVLKFKYKPRMVDGQAVDVTGVETRITFKIEE